MALVSDQLKKVLVRAYERVNGVTPVEGTPEYERMASALMDVCSYVGRYEGETEEQATERFNLDGPPRGEITQLAHHFHELMPGRFDSVGNWDLLFMIQNEYEHKFHTESEQKPDAMSSVSEDEKDAPFDSRMSEATADSASVASSDKNNITNQQGGSNMPENNNTVEQERKALEEKGKGLGENLNDRFSGHGGDPADPAAADEKISKQAATESFASTEQARMAMSTNGRVSGIYVTQPSQAEIFVDGKAAKGYVREPSKQLEKFRVATGWAEGPEGPIFKNVPSDQLENCMRMYETLLKLPEDPEREFEVAVSEKDGSIKLYEVTDGEGKVTLLTPQEMAEFLIIRARGAMYVDPADNSQVLMDPIKKRAGAAGSGRQTKSTNLFSGIAVVKIANRAKAFEKAKKQFKKVNTEVIVDNGVRANSVMSVKVWVKGKEGKGDVEGFKLNKQNLRCIRTLRLPLVVKQYALAVSEQRLSDKCPDTGVGRAVSAVDFNDSKAVAQVDENGIGILAQIISNNRAKNFAEGSEIRKAYDRAQQLQREKAGADANDIGDVMEEQ